MNKEKAGLILVNRSCKGEMALKIIEKVLNNNVVLIYDQDRTEAIIMGAGVGFQKKKGDGIDEKKIEKTFRLNNKDTRRQWENLLRNIPMEYFSLTEEIIEKAEAMGMKLQESILFTLTDHIYHAIERYRDNESIHNGLLIEIKKIYPNEFALGLHGLELIKERFQLRLWEDEAAFISLHVIASQIKGDINDIVHMTEFVEKIISLAEEYLGLVFDIHSHDYYRFVTHVKYLGQRLFSNKVLPDTGKFWRLVEGLNINRERQCVEKIGVYVEQNYGYILTEDEKLYLVIHLLKLTQEIL